jgi:hypothetical protein
MALANSDYEDDEKPAVESSGGVSEAEQPTRELAAAPATGAEDRCANCGAALATDQRYCVECGERRGQSRFPGTQAATEVRTVRRRSAGGPRTQRMSSGATLIAGVGVLLLAIGLGVLIGHLGHTNTSTTRAAAAPTIVTVQGGGAGTTAASTPTTTTAKTPKLSGKLKKAAAATAPPSAAVQKKGQAAAGKVLGNAKNLAPPTVTNGQSCTGAGCQGGKFTGNFFGQ